MKNPPAFQFYPSDFISDEHVVSMTMAERGIYISLLCFCWLHGSIPDNKDAAARLCGATQKEMAGAWETVKARFLPDPNDPIRLRHKRLDAERTKQAEWREKSSRGGATKRQPNLKGGSRVVQPNMLVPLEPNTKRALEPNGNTSVFSLQSSSSSSSPTPLPLSRGVACASDPPPENPLQAAGFESPESFTEWSDSIVANHPNRAKNNFAKQLILEAIMAGRIERMEFEAGYGRYAESQRNRWAEEGGRYCPNLYDILADGRWRYAPVEEPERFLV